MEKSGGRSSIKNDKSLLYSFMNFLWNSKEIKHKNVMLAPNLKGKVSWRSYTEIRIVDC